ncbi:hypothetical protein HYH03_004718 [Edaphochlamys debaryana]|uniref:Jacalin-type lectin domain-containing protein n=1 Tax=Edaphochlamys debaryana TaxID=47281 RepID=A0A836C2T1_9CHLO|nr:hypothetical protein HYH03_004718 [Edaphochlamys debaryana]|eukprot:KAG2497127.1 hypothetical protein HYH03_004718 [Edaphochlamys debaryana]
MAHVPPLQILGVNGTNWAVATPCLSYRARLIYISGIAKGYLEQITFYWAALPASPPPLPPAPPPRPPRPPGPAATFPTQLLMGPFGGGGSQFTPFVDAPPSAGAQLTGIRVYAGSWINAIQVAYNGVWGPRRGGSGGTMQELILASGEVATRAVVRAGGYVDGIVFTTSNNRTVTTGGGGGSPNQAVPCPVGAYKLVGVRGLAGDAQEPYLIQGDCRRTLGCAAVGSGPALQLPGQQLPGQVFGRVGSMNLPRPVNIRMITIILDVCDTGPSNPVSDIELSFAISPNDYLNVFKHEVGHNLGLSHSGRGSNDYGDGSDPMGYCQRCLYNAPHMMQLGWSTPFATLSGTQLPPGVPSDPITIAALTARRNTPVVINADWLPNSADAIYLNSVIVLSYRMRVGQDIGLPDEFDGAVSIHRAPALIGGTVYVEAVVAKGGRAEVAGARLVVSVAPPTQATLSVAVVRMCRYAVSQAECVMG